jgi:hypothetical protein
MRTNIDDYRKSRTGIKYMQQISNAVAELPRNLDCRFLVMDLQMISKSIIEEEKYHPCPLM